MARFALMATSFSSGEIDPLLRARIDLDQYQKGAEILRNVVVQPQGGVTRRPGTRHLFRLPAAANPQNGTRMIAFEFSTSVSYMLVFVHQRMYVFRNGALITNINGSGLDYLAVSALTSTVIKQMCWTQSANTLIITQEDIPPLRILRGGSDTVWTASNISLASVPRYAFDLQAFKPVASLTPSAVAGVVTLTASAYTSDTGNLQAATTTSVTLKAAASSTDGVFNGLCVEMTSGAQAGKARKITSYNGTTKVATVFPPWDTAPLAGDSYKIHPFAQESVGQYINASPQGRARIIEFVNDTSVKAVTEIPFADTTVRTTGLWELECFYEPVWSATRGWPRTCTFHEGRLYFGGSKERPSTIWGSKVGQFFDFEPDQAYDDDAVESTLDTNTLNVITDMISGRDLQIFTTGGEFYVPQEGLQPITPATFFLRAVSRIGAREFIRVKQLQTGTLYIQRQGKALNEFAFSDTTLSYVTSSISLLSSHLLIDPQELALRQSTSTDESDTLYVLNGDGSMAVYSMLRQQNVVAPTRFSTDGLFVDVGVDISDVYVVVKRVFDGVDYFAVERFETELFTDCAFTGAAASGASGLPHEGKTLQVLCDGSPQATEEVTAGAITFERPSVTRYEVGLPINVLIRTLPIEPRLSMGPRVGFKKRIVEINALLYETQNIVINGNPVPIRTFDTPMILDEPVPEFTGTKVLNGVLGYSQDAQITVSQTQPQKLTLLGLEYKLATSGGS